MSTFRNGAVMALGAVAAITALVGVLVGGYVGYRYVTADHARLALVEQVQTSCSGGRDKFREAPSDMPLLKQLDYVERQKAGLGECSVAQVRLLSYDLGIDPDES